MSGGFGIIVSPVAALCSFHDHRANQMHLRDNKIMGTVQTPVLDRNAKAAYIKGYCKQNGVDPIDPATIGDGANDLVMLQAAGMCVAFEGEPLLLAKVAIQLNHTDLCRLLRLQGFKERDFIANKIRGSIFPIQIKGAEPGPFVFNVKIWHLQFRSEVTAYFLAKLI